MDRNKQLNRMILAASMMTVIVLTALPSCRRRAEEPQAEENTDTIYPLGFCTDSFDLVEGKVGSGEVFTGLMTRLGMTQADAMSLVAVADSVFEPRKMRAGNAWQAYYRTDSLEFQSLEYLVYHRDRINLTVLKCTSPFGAWRVTKPVTRTKKFSDVSITSSLWNDMTAAGASPMLLVHLEDIYAWTVDFFGLQKGDRFRVIYTESTCEGEVIDIDTIHIAMFTRDDKEMPAIRFDQGEGGNLYWNEKGESMRKAFLKAPLRFSRISSGFSYHRKHPVSGVVKAHTGVDYAAPAGTPVMSIGDGTVISKGWSGGGGNTVKIRHNSVYTTAYLHLSRYASGLAVGSRVRQGDVIGYVGSTGVSTGPHLDFRVWRSGQPINPLKMESPSEEPIKPENLPALDSVYRYWHAELDSLSRLNSVSALRDSVSVQ
ncbi:MAG: peptidoglycan DD-metalloendopeptidase family protein [Candidatus Cryptobacteroides sp.]